MTVQIHGKEYRTVAERVAEFRDRHSDWLIRTKIINITENRVVMVAKIYNPIGKLISTGHAEEIRAASNINKLSALENAETSAVGRALAFYGLGGEEIASADELASQIHKETSMNGTDVDISKLQAVVDEAIRMIDEDSPDVDVTAQSAKEMYAPLTNDEKMWVNGQLRNRKTTNEGTGREVQYWSFFAKLLNHKQERT